MSKFKETHGEGKKKPGDNTVIIVTREVVEEVPMTHRIEQLNRIITDAQANIAYTQEIIDSAQAELNSLD